MKAIKKFFAYLAARPLVFCLISSPLMNLFIESLHRRSFISGLSHMLFNPLIFIYNSLIIFMTLSFAMLFRRKYFFFSLILTFWLILGVTNGVLRLYRDNPLTAVDFFILRASGDFIKKFFGWWQITLAVLVVAFLISLGVLMWKKGPRPFIKKISAISLIVVSMLTLGCATVVGMETAMLSSEFDDLAQAYENYGFAYCFSCSVFDNGIDEPEKYSNKAIEKILAKLPQDSSKDAKVKPDIVVVQLESFFDFKYVRGVEISEETVPNFRALTESYPSGFISVQSIGGGTANTEFEVLTGMNLEHFGAAEYPYMTVLCDDTIPALPHFLGELGYSSHAFHNYTGAFYDRYKVYKNLGFDSFTPIEYMSGLSYNPSGWAKDSSLIPYITDALDEEGNTFVWAISVQAHGAYPDELTECEYDIKLSGIEEEKLAAASYYVNQIREVDDFIGALIGELSMREEPTVVILYGDHLPPLELEQSALDGTDLYQSEYVVWSNFEMENTDRDLEAYQLISHAFGLFGYNPGITTKLNQLGGENPNYQADLMMLEYDLVYGESFAIGTKRYLPAELKMGREAICVNGILSEEERLYVYGENFTEWSRIAINSDEKDTVFIDNNTLMLEEYKVREDDVISVVQVANSGVVFGESNKIIKEDG